MADQKLVTVIDYGMGNLRSVAKAAEHVAGSNTRICISSKADDIAAADAIIFPGQGAAKACMKALNESNISHTLMQAASEKPFLGICMGLQVLMTHSQENEGVDCLDILKGDVQQFDLSTYPELKMPHMGWNQIHQTTDHPLWHNIEQDSRFYFVHSYFVSPHDKHIIAGETTHGNKFTSAIAQDNLFAIQAHPEKSADAGLQLFKNFLDWNGQ
ncbi:imidazole glycerol phosphate synthase subunit HisH [Hydrogenovibrio sp. 3SP14C1]|uniref:imidazole glycerol phosphate synthase subunit HisH n=1 Tax=Hydrogenovibrio sp. 3SP14C1 TaxID=3038774 RepID=UPI002416868C|nr:imidazole glycerol phosphate synthase subunit HisH [Hydrogenovibrio sp. 3SP14C1]MDG4811394.1 imidazole glycerol phosphate synthase subunit HisH [Hydrogenovibrio sp. 3SP14C1]